MGPETGVLLDDGRPRAPRAVRHGTSESDDPFLRSSDFSRASPAVEAEWNICWRIDRDTGRNRS